MSQSSSFGVTFLLGPTAVGKTHLSLYLAEKLSASILNCDSIQMYKGLDIGSAKPQLQHCGYLKNGLNQHFIFSNCEEDFSSNEVEKFSESQNYIKKIPAFLFDEWEPPFICTAGLFRKKALSVLKQELSHRPVLAVGGSGFYIQALEKGMYPIGEVKPEIKQQVNKIHKEKGLEHLYKLLQFLDPEYAKQIPAQDSYRIFRGICIILSEEKPLSLIRSSFKKQKLPWPYLKVGLYLPREALLKNVQERTHNMIKGGLLEETQALLDKGLADWPVMRSVGYREAVLFLQNNFFKDELKNRIIHRTMGLVKKQMSWFKRDKSIQWYLSENKNWSNIYYLIKDKFEGSK